MARKFTNEHKRKISQSLKKYHKTCKKSKSSDNTEKQIKSFLAGIKSKSKSSDNTEKKIKSFLSGIKSKSKSKSSKSSDMKKKKQLQKEIEKLKEMIKTK